MKKEKEIKKFPGKSKFKKFQRGSLHLINYFSQNKKSFTGFYAIKTLSCGFIKWKTLIEVYKVLKRILKKKKNKIKIYINTVLNWPVSKKPKGTRMGKGKGKVGFEDWIARISAGKHLIEFSYCPLLLAEKSFKIAESLLPFPCAFVKKK